MTSSLRVSPVRAQLGSKYNSGLKNNRQPAYSSAYAKKLSKNETRAKLQVIENTSSSNAFDAKFTLFLVGICIGTFVIILLLNIFVSSISIKAGMVSGEIQRVKEDTQTIKAQIDQRGDAIAQRAAALGMVSRDKWINIRLENRKTTQSDAVVGGDN
jgi:hypothetical protein